MFISKIISVIFWILLFMLAYRAVKYILRMMSGGENKNESPKPKRPSKFNINKDDIIEADFEEIKDSEQDKSK